MNILKEAHKLTKEIKREYPKVNYKFQLGLCITYLSENKGEVKMTAIEKIENEIKEIAESRGYKDDFEVSVKPWETKDKSKKRVYINVKIGKKQAKGYIDCLTSKCYWDDDSVSVLKEVRKRMFVVLEENKNELITL